MKREEKFYSQLREVPELPDNLFEKIDKKISHKNITKKILLSVAATLVLSIGSLGLAFYQSKVPEVDEIVAMELDDVWNYVNGYDIDQDLDMFAIMEDY